MITLKVFTPEQHKRGLLQIIQDVHMTHNGSIDRNNAFQINDINVLRKCKDGWEHNNLNNYDSAVYSLLIAVLLEIYPLRK